MQRLKRNSGFRRLAKYQGGWVQLIIFVISLIISIVLAPKPQTPKPASLEDFDVPLAEEDRPIPVLFGTKRITGANIVWYGDLSVHSIRKSSMFSSQTIGYRYYLGLHMVFCHGPIDCFYRLEADDKLIDTVNITAPASVKFNRFELFGGDKREGGLAGKVDFMFGEDTQAPNAYLQHVIGEPMPAYRGVAGIVYRPPQFDEGTLPGGIGFSDNRFFGKGQGGYVGNTPYVKPWQVTCRRILKGWQGDAVWYSAKAAIGTAMNPAHIIYQCLTDGEWGQGSPTTLIDDANFRAAADLLYDEGFGLNMLWNQTTTINDFLQEVLDHVAGILGFDVLTGKYVLRIIRGDYNPAALATFDPSNSIAATNYQKRTWAETVNELTIAYTDPVTGKPTDIVVQDLGNIRAQGARIPDKFSRIGISDNEVIKVVAGRELASRSTPLSRLDLTVNRVGWSYGPGDVVKVRWPEFELDTTVMRVITMRRGNLENRSIEVSLVEDIYALSGIQYTTGQPPADAPDIPDQPDDGPDTGGTVISSNATTPPSSPNDGDRYHVGSGATGDWLGHGGQLAEWSETDNEWLFTDPPPGVIISDQSTGGQVVIDEYGEVHASPWTPAIPNLPDYPGTTLDSADSLLVVWSDADQAYYALPPDLIAVTLPLTTKGDLLVQGVSSLGRLGVGSNGKNIVADSAATLGVKWDDPPTSVLTTKGDILVKTASGLARLAVGTDGQVVSADSTMTTGLKWIDAAAGSLSGAVLTRSAVQSIPNSTTTQVSWDQETYDTDGYHESVTHPTRITIPSDGTYLLGANVDWAGGGSSGNRIAWITLNGSTQIPANQTFEAAIDLRYNMVAPPQQCVAGDYFELNVYQTSGGSRDLAIASNALAFWVMKVQGSGGGGGGGGYGPDAVPSVPNAQDDEFNTGTTINTSKWTARNIGGSGVGGHSISQGCLQLKANFGSGDRLYCYEQAVSGSTWKYRCKSAAWGIVSGHDIRGGLYVVNNANGKILNQGTYYGGSVGQSFVNKQTDANNNVGNLFVASGSGVSGLQGIAGGAWFYYEIEYDGTTIFFRESSSGVDGTYMEVVSTTPGAFLGAAPTHIGIWASCSVIDAGGALFDWFRKVA